MLFRNFRRKNTDKIRKAGTTNIKEGRIQERKGSQPTRNYISERSMRKREEEGRKCKREEDTRRKREGKG